MAPPINPVTPPTRGPPKRAAIKVVMWDKSRAKEKFRGPTGIDGMRGERWMDSNESTLPRAAIMDMNVKFFELRILLMIYPS